MITTNPRMVGEDLEDGALPGLESQWERDRRYEALRSSMEEQRLDALVVASQGDGTSHGRITYLAKYVYQGAVVMIVFPKVGSPILITDPLPVWPAGNWIDEEHTRAASNVGVEAGNVLLELGLSDGRIGLVGRDDVRQSDYEAIISLVPSAQLLEARDTFERVALIKSAAEVKAYRTTAAIGKRAATALEASLWPGQSERAAIAEAHRILHQFGCGVSAIAISKRPFATRGHLCSSGFRPPTDESIRKTDVIVIEFDITGPEGYGVEFRRVYSFAPLDDRSAAFMAWREEVFQACLEAMKPGVDAQTINTVVLDKYAEAGYKDTEQSPQWHAHGLGLGLEPPYVPGPNVTLQEGMVVVLHPILRLDEAEMAAVGDLGPSDNVVITASGCERIVDPRQGISVVLS